MPVRMRNPNRASTGCTNPQRRCHSSRRGPEIGAAFLQSTKSRAVPDGVEEVNVDSVVRSVILTGDGRGFCSGLDLTGYGHLPGSEKLGRVPTGMRVQQHIARLTTQMRGLSKPVIAAVNGPAAGGGLALALASDIRIAATSAKFNVAFVRIGLSGCDIGVSWMLPRLIGASKAFELLLTGRIIDAEEADRIGLVFQVVHDGTVVEAAIATARRIAARAGTRCPTTSRPARSIIRS